MQRAVQLGNVRIAAEDRMESEQILKRLEQEVLPNVSHISGSLRIACITGLKVKSDGSRLVVVPDFAKHCKVQ